MNRLTIRDRDDGVSELLLYDVIGGDFFSEGVTARDFRASLKAVRSKTLNLRINSPGGSVTEAAAILNALDEWPGRIEVDVDGLAASAASVVAMAGDRIRVSSNGLLMIHDPSAMAGGNAADMRRMADLLDKVKEQIADAYMRHAKVSREQIVAWMAEEKWFAGGEAVACGLAHETSAPMRMAACADFKTVAAKLGYRKVPAALAAAEAEAWERTNDRRERLAALAAGAK